MQRIGELMHKLLAELSATYAGEDAYQIRRTISLCCSASSGSTSISSLPRPDHLLQMRLQTFVSPLFLTKR